MFSQSFIFMLFNISHKDNALSKNHQRDIKSESFKFAFTLDI